MLEKYKVPVEKLKNKCDKNIFPYDTTEKWMVDRELIGQERAMEALKYGLSMKRKGYHIFVSGATGTGRNSYSYLVAKEYAKKKSKPNDWIYVYNFENSNSPKAINLDAGEGMKFKLSFENAIKDIESEMPRVLSSKIYEDKKNIILNENQKMAEDILKDLNKVAEKYNFIFKQTDRGILSLPLIEGKPMTDKEIDKISDEEMENIRETSLILSRESYDYIKKIKEVEDKLNIEIIELQEDHVFKNIQKFINPIMEKYEETQKIKEFLIAVKKDILENYDEFLDKEEESYIENFWVMNNKKEDFLKRYTINLFIDNSNTPYGPVIREMNPTYHNLFGKVEYVNEMGGTKINHTMIKPGSMHEANGGYILIQAKDILQSKVAWDGLKRSIITGELKIENSISSNTISQTIKPESIPLDLKIIIIGDYMTYHLLYNYDEDFKKYFKIRADFDIEMERNKENILKIGSFVAYQCKEENLLPFDREALARIVELSSRITEDVNKLTSEFNELVEVIYEADGWASADCKEVVTKEYVDKAIEKKRYRNNSYEEKLLELIKEGTILIDTEGEKIGEINGLSVIDLGQYSFGRPTKITANTYLGKDGIINIEKEVEQSGNIHDKGVLIMSGYLGERYAQDIQLSMTASITFEQSYDGVDGDSASSTELYALLSSLSELPIKQNIGVTGSVNQKGLIQPIGGVNEKIEGFYEVCKLKGFKGGEGVIIPSKNIGNLMLNEEVIEAVKSKIFTIYAIDTIDQGMEVLTGIKAGELNESGEYEEESVNFHIRNKLIYYSLMSDEIEEEEE